MFPQNLVKDFLVNKLKETIKLLDIIKTVELHNKSKRKKVYKFSEQFLPTVF